MFSLSVEVILGISKPLELLEMSRRADADGVVVPIPTFCEESAVANKENDTSRKKCLIVKK
jgi:hypothetical protein